MYHLKNTMTPITTFLLPRALAPSCGISGCFRKSIKKSVCLFFFLQLKADWFKRGEKMWLHESRIANMLVYYSNVRFGVFFVMINGHFRECFCFENLLKQFSHYFLRYLFCPFVSSATQGAPSPIGWEVLDKRIHQQPHTGQLIVFIPKLFVVGDFRGLWCTHSIFLRNVHKDGDHLSPCELLWNYCLTNLFPDFIIYLLFFAICCKPKIEGIRQLLIRCR